MSAGVWQIAGGVPAWLDHLGPILHSADALGYMAATLTVVTYSMKTMIPLRAIGIAANCLFIAYGYFAPAYPQLFLHAVLLPLNCTRLYQMTRLVSLVRQASESDLSMEWIRTFTRARRCAAGEIVFSKHDIADAMYYTASGRYLLVELNLEVVPGEIIGEMGLVAPEGCRTQTFKCIEDGELLIITYAQVKQLYFQNPRFGFFFLNLITRRLFENHDKVEGALKRASSGTPEACPD